MSSTNCLPNNLQEAFDAFLHFKAFKAAIVNPAIKYTVWRFVTEGLKPSPNLCNNCADHNGDLYELKDPDELQDKFPYGEWLDEDTFSVNLHPNCCCLIIRDHNVYW